MAKCELTGINCQHIWIIDAVNCEQVTEDLQETKRIHIISLIRKKMKKGKKGRNIIP